MLRIAGYSTSIVSAVQSPVAEIISSGRGAIVAAISRLLVSSRRPGMFSQRHPPCMCSEIMLTGAATATRGSIDGEQERLRAAAGLSRDSEAVAADVGQRLEKIERADRIPQLQAAEAQAPEVLPASAERVRQLPAVAVADHVVREDDEALARETDRPSWNRVDRGVLQAAVGPVPVRRQDGRERTVADRPVQISGDEEPGQALEVHLRHRVVRVRDFVEDHRTERRPIRHRHQPGRREHVVMEVLRARRPLFGAREPRRLEPVVMRPGTAAARRAGSQRPRKERSSSESSSPSTRGNDTRRGEARTP